jgi:hypothetical protein
MRIIIGLLDNDFSITDSRMISECWLESFENVSDHAPLWITIPIFSQGSEEICEKPATTAGLRVESPAEC